MKNVKIFEFIPYLIRSKLFRKFVLRNYCFIIDASSFGRFFLLRYVFASLYEPNRKIHIYENFPRCSLLRAIHETSVRRGTLNKIAYSFNFFERIHFLELWIHEKKKMKY